MKPLFMWAGGKTRLLKRYQEYLPERFTSYVEPFLGAGAVFLWAYQKNPSASFVLNDANEGIMGVYRAVRNDLDAFQARLDELQAEYLPLKKPARKEFYYKVRHSHAYDFEGWDRTYEAATLYFLMRTGFNGIWQINHNTNDRFGTPAGLLKHRDAVYDVENLHAWHEALQGCYLHCESFENVTAIAGQGSFLFLDPPYRGCFTQYGVTFDDDDQRRVVTAFEAAAEKGAHALLSNRDLGDGFFDGTSAELVTFNVTYTAGRRKGHADGTYSAKKAQEVLLVSRP